MITLERLQNHMSFSDWLKQKRFASGISQAELARRVDVTRQYIHILEKGERSVEIGPALVTKIANAFIETGVDTTIYEAFKEAGLGVPESPPEIDNEAALLLDQMMDKWTRLRGRVPSADSPPNERSLVEGNEALVRLEDEAIQTGLQGVFVFFSEAYGADLFYRTDRGIPGLAESGNSIALLTPEQYQPNDKVLVIGPDEEVICVRYREVAEEKKAGILGKVKGILKMDLIPAEEEPRPD